jgi:hypothetical protein
MRSPFLFLVLLTGCPDPTDKQETGDGTDDTADTEVVYDSGCITVDGGGGYAKLADAVTLAPDGAVIELCDGNYDEAVTVDKPVTIRGASTAGTFLSGPGSDIPLTITGMGVTVENLTLSSARTGIVIGSGAEATLTNVTVGAAGSWGVSSTGATLAITGLIVVEPASGGIQISGGDVSIADSSFEYPGGFGIDVADDAVVTVSGTTITGTVMLSDDVSDGFAVQVEGATFSMSGSTVAGADGMGIFANEADITLADTTFQDAYYLAIYATASTYDITGISVTGTVLQGIYATGSSFTMADSTVSADSELSCSYAYADWGVKYGPWCGGMYIVADTIALTDVNVSGWNNYGWVVAPDSEDLTTVDINGGVVDNVGRWGAYVASATGTVSGLTVTNSREPEIVDPCAGYINQSAGVLNDSSDVTFDGLVVSGNAGWGLSNVFGSAVVTNSTFDGNGCYTVVNYQSSATLTGNTFTHGAANGGVYDSEGVLTLDGNSFVDNSAGAYSRYDYGDYIYTYEASGGQGQDLFAYGTAALTVTNNTFVGGDSSVGAYLAGSVEVTGNSWTDYEGTVFSASYLTDTAIFANNTLDDIAGYAVYASASDVEVSNVQIGTTRASDPIDVTYSYDYPNDENDFSGSYTSSSSSYVFYAYGSYYDDGSTVTEDPASLSISDVTVGNSYSILLYSYNASVDVSGLSVGDVGSYLMYGSWDGFAPDVEIDGLTAGAVSSGAFLFYNYTPSDAGSVYLSNVDVESASGNGISTTALGTLSLADVDFGTVYGSGISAASRSYDYAYDSTTGSYVYTDLDAATEVTVDGLSFDTVYGNALTLQGGSATLDGLTVASATGDGVSAEGLSSLSIRDSSIAGVGGSGISSSDSYAYYSYETYTYSTVAAATVATLSNVTVTDTYSDALSFDGGTVSLAGVSGASAGGSGLELSNVTAEVVGNTFTGNDAYGMSCESGTVTLASCSTNDLSGNVLGTHLGCADSCAE